MKGMLKSVLMLSAMLFAGSMLYASQRVVVAEDFTATWCQYCPDAAKALDSIYRVAPDSFIIIAYHPSGTDPFQIQASVDRANYYALEFYPTVFFGGGYTSSTTTLVGSFGTDTYDSCRIRFDNLKTVDSPLYMSIAYLGYDDIARTGTMSIKVRNTSASPVSGKLQFLVLERGIPYAWQTMSELDFLVRDMIPNAAGEDLAISAGDSAVVVRDFTIGPDWAFGNCNFVAFVQTIDHQILQGAQAYGPSLVLESKTLTEASGNGNGFYEPGETGSITVKARGKWADAQGAKIKIASADTFINITSDNYYVGAIAEGDTVDNNAMPFEFQVLPNANISEGHQVTIKIYCELYHPGLNDTVTVYVDSIKFMVGSPNTIFFDDFESGLGGWATGYVGNFAQWDTIDTDYYSSSHCITDSKGGDYPNTSSHWIQMTSGLDLRSYGTASLSWWEKCFTQTGDYCRLERSINSGVTWSELKAFSGTVAGWTKNTVDLSSFCGDTISNFRLRFKMTSNSSGTADGWYVDDVMILGYTKSTGVSGKPETPSLPGASLLKGAYPNPFRGNVNVEFQIGEDLPVSLKIYNISGELVSTLLDSRLSRGEYSIPWNGRDSRNQNISSGVYIYRLEAGNKQAVGKITYIR